MNLLKQITCCGSTEMMMTTSRKRANQHIALDLARRAALSTFPTVAERAVDEDLPTWRENRLHVMNERPCDHEENGIRAWRIA
jgi:hypothetical protein